MTKTRRTGSGVNGPMPRLSPEVAALSSEPWQQRPPPLTRPGCARFADGMRPLVIGHRGARRLAIENTLDALKIALDASHPVTRTEHIPLVSADGRVAAHDVISPLDVPPFDRAAMDGFAVRAADVTPGATLTCIGRVFTGEVFAGEVRHGECVEIATGAPMPAGADAVGEHHEIGDFAAAAFESHLDLVAGFHSAGAAFALNIVLAAKASE